MHARNVGVIESLESRRLLSGATLGTGGVLRVWGDDLKLNSITFANNIDGVTLDVTITSTNGAGVPKSITRSFARSAVNSVWVSGGSKDDVINAAVLTVGVRADGRGGSDTIDTGSGTDLVFAGGGDDNVETRNGNDRIFGGFGNDTIDAGGDDDRVSGGWGNDTLRLGGGDDFARGDAGNDFLYGHNGMDTLYGCGGLDELYGERDNDTLWGGDGNDRLFGGDDNDTLGGVLGTNTLMGEDGFDTFIVVRLALQPTNDFLTGTDSEVQVTGGKEGPPVPAV